MTQFKKDASFSHIVISEWVSCTRGKLGFRLGKSEHIPIIIVRPISSLSAADNIISVIILPISTKTCLMWLFTDAVSLFLHPNHQKSSNSVLFYEMLARQRVASYVRKYKTFISWKYVCFFKEER